MTTYEQYIYHKSRHPHDIVLLRVMDCYEVFEDDAEYLAELLGLRLIIRKDYADAFGNPVPMVAFFKSDLNDYNNAIIDAGRTIDIERYDYRMRKKKH